MSDITKYIITDRNPIWAEQLQGFKKIVPVCFDTLCRKLRQQALMLDPQKYIILLPGNSALDTWKRMDLSGFEVLQVYAKRTWNPGSDAYVTVETLPVPRKLSGKNTVVIDDVVSTGTTVSMLKQRNQHLFPSMHDKPWKLLSPISRREKLSGFDLSYECLIETEQGRKPPVNSLSTLIDNPDILESYVLRNVCPSQQSRFMDLFS